jgi:LAO/AO transport system kinase
VGQSELDVARAADTTVVVVVPESGDSIQALKAGLMEIADIFVVNKSDREGADRLVGDLESALSLKHWRDRWKPLVLKTTASNGQGLQELEEALEQHRAWLEQSGELHTRRREAIRARLIELVREEVGREVLGSKTPQALDALVGEVLAGRYSPYRAAQDWTRDWISRAGPEAPARNR